MNFKLILVLGISFLFKPFNLQAASKKNNRVKPKVEDIKLETATFAAGCFWGTEEFFRKIQGVVTTKVGYTGGVSVNPRYDDMHDGHTRHAESLELQFDPKKVKYEFL